MRAADRLAKQFGTNIDESMGANAVHGGPGLYPTGIPGTVHGGPAKFQGASRIKDALSIELDRISPDPDQPRKEFDAEELADLAASLKARGQLQPIRVRWDDQGGRWIVIAGERRYRAAKLAGLTALVCIEAKGPMSADEILEDQIVENCLRSDLKPVEQGRAFRALMDRRGYSGRQLAETLRISHQSVGRALALLDLPADVQVQVDAGVIPATAASEVAKVQDETVRRDLVEKIATGKMTRDETVAIVRRKTAAKGRGGKPKKVTERSFRAPSGPRVVVEFKRGLDLAAIRTALAEFLAALDSESVEAAA